jgi:preprotein translocase subunit SecD
MLKRALIPLLLACAPAWAEPVMVFTAGKDKIEFGPGDIIKAEPQSDPVTGNNVVLILMSPPKGRAFTDLTTRHLNETVDVHVCGALIISPRVMQPILGGSVYLTSAGTFDETIALAKMLKTGECVGDAGQGKDGKGEGGIGKGEGKPSS